MKKTVLALSTLVLGLAALALRLPRWAVLACLVVAVNLAIIHLKAEPAAGPPPAASRQVKLLTLNLLGENYYTGRVSRYLRQTAADIVVLEENTPYWSEKLVELRDLYPYTWPDILPFSSDVLVLSRYRPRRTCRSPARTMNGAMPCASWSIWAMRGSRSTACIPTRRARGRSSRRATPISRPWAPRWRRATRACRT